MITTKVGVFKKNIIMSWYIHLNVLDPKLVLYVSLLLYLQ